MLNTKQRAARVLASQGRSKGWLESLPLADADTLAAMCDAHGNVAADVRDRFAAWRDGYYESQKATVEEAE